VKKLKNISNSAVALAALVELAAVELTRLEAEARDAGA
jgi:hypothetical protein